MSVNMMYTAISGLDTFNQALSVTSNNIANANTTAFKSETVDFGDLVSGFMPTSSGDDSAQGVGSSILSTSTDQSTGTEMQTDLWSDLMIQGTGYFKVQDPNSLDNYYTRDGSFQINANGFLTTANGDEVLASDGATPINVDTADPGATFSSYSVDQYGNLCGMESDGQQPTLAIIGVTTFSNPSGLVSNGNNLLTTGPNSGAATLGTASDASDGSGTMLSGMLEGSNVDITAQMVNLIDYQADYQANSKSIVTANTLLQTAVNLIQG